MTSDHAGGGQPDHGRPSTEPTGEVRLQALLAKAGVASRRAAEELIQMGRVTVGGEVVTRLGTKVDPTTARVEVDGDRIEVDPTRVHLVLNKPRGMLSTMADPQGRPCLADVVGDRVERLFHVGRLDADSEGLILLTNDGDLAHQLMHPSFGVGKTYLAEVPAPVRRDLGQQLRAGIELADGPVAVDSFRVVQTVDGPSGPRAQVEVVLHEGRNHIVRRMLAAVGYPVSRLVRTRIGPVALGDLRAGAVRPLRADELAELHAAAANKPADRRRLPRKVVPGQQSQRYR